jgi:hypothetical protein
VYSRQKEWNENADSTIKENYTDRKGFEQDSVERAVACLGCIITSTEKCSVREGKWEMRDCVSIIRIKRVPSKVWIEQFSVAVIRAGRTCIATLTAARVGPLQRGSPVRLPRNTETLKVVPVLN